MELMKGKKASFSNLLLMLIILILGTVLVMVVRKSTAAMSATVVTYEASSSDYRLRMTRYSEKQAFDESKAAKVTADMVTGTADYITYIAGDIFWDGGDVGVLEGAKVRVVYESKNLSEGTAVVENGKASFGVAELDDTIGNTINRVILILPDTQEEIEFTVTKVS